MARKSVAVSRLADYAADPEGFIERRGQVRNAAAARAGTRHHDNLGRSNRIGWWLLIASLVVVALVLARMVWS